MQDVYLKMVQGHNMHYAKFDRSDLRAHLTLDQFSRSPRSVAGSPQDRCVDQG